MPHVLDIKSSQSRIITVFINIEIYKKGIQVKLELICQNRSNDEIISVVFVNYRTHNSIETDF